MRLMNVLSTTVLAASMYAAGAAAAAAQAPLPIPAAAFFSDPAVTSAGISPDGKRVVMITSAKGVRPGIVVVDLATMTPAVVGRYADLDVQRAWWLNDKRLAFTVGNLKPGTGNFKTGMYAVDADGGAPVPVSETIEPARTFAQTDCACSWGSPKLIVQSLRTSDNVMVTVRYEDNESASAIGRLDTRTGLVERLTAPAHPEQWLVDTDETLRFVLSRDGATHVLHQRDAGGSWRKVQTFDPDSAAAFRLQAYIGGVLYVSSARGGDTRALYRYDLAKGRMADQPLVTAPGFDVNAEFVSDGKKLLGLHLQTEGDRSVWFDPAMKALQERIDALLPNTDNLIARGMRSETSFVLVQTQAPGQGRKVLVFNQDSGKLTLLRAAYEELDRARLGATEFVHYRARDGLPIPTYVTLPRSGARRALPTIILVGRSPMQREADFSFQPAVQFLASRGYAVIQPEARGVPGFGNAHALAGRKQWGRAMQDDLADGAKWAIAQGIADPARICIAGTLYGGYAALMGVINDPALFRCAVSVGGVTHLDAMFSNRWEDFPGAGDLPAMRWRVGNPGADGAQFKATSPLAQAARIKAPVLLAYGARDVQVPVREGRQLYAAIRAAGNAQAQWALYDEKGQDWSLADNRIDLWTRIEQFLAGQLGQP